MINNREQAGKKKEVKNRRRNWEQLKNRKENNRKSWRGENNESRRGISKSVQIERKRKNNLATIQIILARPKTSACWL